jgi:molybdenum cofactor biosynthesis enzyme MoaA
MKKILLELELTNICNAQCVMCPVVGMKRQKGFMTHETLELIVKKGIDYGIQTIRFCGLGEPLLHKAFCQFLSSVKKHHHLTAELITNGSLLRKDTVQCLITHHIDFLSISFPSLIMENYEKIMKGLVFQEVLERVVYAISELKQASGTHIKITSALTGINDDEKAQIQHFWTRKGVDCVELHTTHNRGGHLKDTGYLAPSSQSESTPDPRIEKSLCPWPLRQFFIAWDGSVFLCCCDMEGECHVGNIHTDDFSELERMQEIMSIRQPNLCKRCSYQRAERML